MQCLFSQSTSKFVQLKLTNTETGGQKTLPFQYSDFLVTGLLNCERSNVKARALFCHKNDVHDFLPGLRVLVCLQCQEPHKGPQVFIQLFHNRWTRPRVNLQTKPQMDSSSFATVNFGGNQFCSHELSRTQLLVVLGATTHCTFRKRVEGSLS